MLVVFFLCLWVYQDLVNEYSHDLILIRIENMIHEVHEHYVGIRQTKKHN